MSASDRYARQIQFAPIGQRGQDLIGDANIAIVGCGALGTVAAELLARAGVNRIRIIDRDVVEWTNLQRQSLFDESDATVSLAKAEAASNRLSQINSQVSIDPRVCDLNRDNISELLTNIDLVIDATDNYQTRFLLNDWSLSTRTPWVHGGCVGACGQVMLFRGEGNPCLRCFLPQPPTPEYIETCDTSGVLGAATHFIASLQVSEAIKSFVDPDLVRTKMISVDLWNNRIREFDPPVTDSCLACQQQEFEWLEGSNETGDHSTILCGRDSVQLQLTGAKSIDFSVMNERWQGLGRVQSTRFFIRLILEEHSLTLFNDGRVVVSGTRDVAEAKTLYSRFVGA